MINLKPITSVENMPVLDLESGAVLGRILGWVFNLHQQRLVAFVINRGGLMMPQQVLAPTDIVEYGPKMIIVRNRQAIIQPKEIMNLPELIKQQSNPLGLVAESLDGKILGKVDNFDIDTVSSLIQRYHIRPTLIGSLAQPDLLLPASKLVKVQKNRLVFDAGPAPIDAAHSHATQTEIS